MGSRKKQLDRKDRAQKASKVILKKNPSIFFCAGGGTWIIILCLAGACTVFSLVTLYDLMGNSEARIYAVSEILKKNVELSQQLIDQKIRIEEFLHNDQIVDLIKSTMRPMQERVASLMIQTSQYEKLPYIPGGPKSFITSTLKELDSIENKYLMEIAQELLKKLKTRTIKAQELEKESKKVFTTSSDVLSSISNDVILEFLIREGVFLIPETEDILDVSLENYKYSDLVKAHTELANLFRIYEKCLLFISEYVNEHYPLHPEHWKNWDPEDFPEDVELQAMLWVFHEEKQKLRTAVERNSDKYPLLLVYSMQLIQASKVLISKLVDYEQSMRSPYIKLQGIILTDIKKLRIRVENLRYSYAKKPYSL